MTTAKQSKDTAIGEVLNQNLEAAEQIKAAASELEVVHAVLSTQVPAKAAQGDLKAAVERTGEIEQQLSETAEAMDKSNAVLRELDSSTATGPTARK
ncbi:hypothetical protein AcdelDRAFT_0179 [Acidovorax delafieldii 2AN]|uniref:Methyl-accepting chemotaxis sensory transducer n=1 Tax=Acidovorax delafieldii 2AN TaxID=573060 RepID=C5SZU9_ACIDE|nr:hypothetical protein [Acidovorax delafieldii]EER62265.1 hypothetical protein AcdelDRAFT_0179 [Acidovorax delafieldii 2AN]